ncbi:MAG: PAS domain-containing protein [Rhizomicrobium sp.]|nr:PAS domain-containing protein [Rhizomicrobium sp.]
MSAAGAPDRRFPGLTSINFVPVTELEQRAVKLGFAYWQRLQGTRKFPARGQIRPNEIVAALSHSSLIKVWDGGSDFEVRIAGDAMNCAYRAPLNGRLISDIASDLPLMASRWRRIFGEILATGLPVAVRTRAGHDLPETNFSDSEAVFLPLGENDNTVDHLLLFAQHERRTS